MPVWASNPPISSLRISAMLHGKALNSTLLLLLIIFATAFGRSYPRFSRNDTEFQHLVLHPDPSVGTVYVGARDHLFQLDGSDGLRLEQEETTGPVSDSKDCLPPVTELNCPHARRTSNHNKLLLVDPKASELITCGSIHQGTCQKRSLTSIKKVLFSTERPVDTQYVAANDPSVSTVGLVVGLRGGERTVMYVGRGYTASHPPISTRHLSSEPIFSYEETAKLAVAGRLSEYDHHFVMAFTRRSYVYFLFYRRDIKSASREYRTYAARVCLDDTSYYSYVEVPLVCRSHSSHHRTYNLLQAAQVFPICVYIHQSATTLKALSGEVNNCRLIISLLCCWETLGPGILLKATCPAPLIQALPAGRVPQQNNSEHALPPQKNCSGVAQGT